MILFLGSNFLYSVWYRCLVRNLVRLGKFTLSICMLWLVGPERLLSSIVTEITTAKHPQKQVKTERTIDYTNIR